MMRACAMLLAVTAALAATGEARAFSDPISFSDPVQMGGGGGRYFTGSASDGYGCNVCHAGGARAEATITGLPLSGYRTGTAYEVRVEWPATLEHMGLMLEITDASGARAGAVRLPPESELTNEERCEPVEDGFMAGELIETEQRTLVSVPDCGAKRVRFLWTAPGDPRGTLRFSGALVASDGEADAAGDGVTLFAHALPQARGSVPAADVTAGCNASARGGSSERALLIFALAVWLARRRLVG